MNRDVKSYAAIMGEERRKLIENAQQFAPKTVGIEGDFITGEFKWTGDQTMTDLYFIMDGEKPKRIGETVDGIGLKPGDIVKVVGQDARTFENGDRIMINGIEYVRAASERESTNKIAAEIMARVEILIEATKDAQVKETVEVQEREPEMMKRLAMWSYNMEEAARIITALGWPQAGKAMLAQINRDPRWLDLEERP